MINHNQEIEINVKELLWNIVSQWKACFIIALIIAALLTAGEYFKDNNTYKNALEGQKQDEEMAGIPVDEQIEKMIDALPEADRTEVVHFVQEKEWLETEKEYYSNSILLQVNPTSQRTLILDYYIVSGETNNSIATPLVYGYSSYTYSEKLVGDIRDQIDPETDKRYISELISTSTNNSSIQNVIVGDEDNDAILEVRIVLPEQVDAKLVESVVTTDFNAYSEELNKTIGRHSIKLIEASECRLYNNTAVNNKNSITANIYNIENTYLKNMEASLSDEQKAVVSSIMGIREKANSADSEGNVKTKAGQKSEVLAKPGVSKKVALGGFILGVIIYMFVYVLLLISKGWLQDADQMISFTGGRLLGEVCWTDDKSKGLRKLYQSELVRRIRYKKTLDIDKQIEKVSTSIDIACQHSNIDKITLLTISNLGAKEFLFKKLHDCIARKGIQLDVVKADDMLESKLLNTENAIIIAGNDTKASELIHLIELTNCFDVNIIGNLFIKKV